MGILSKVSGILSESSKYVYRTYFTKGGKRKKRRFLRDRNKGRKTYLETQHFRTFSPVRRFK